MKEIEEIEFQIESEMGISLNNYKSNEIEEIIANMLISLSIFLRKYYSQFYYSHQYFSLVFFYWNSLLLPLYFI